MQPSRLQKLAPFPRITNIYKITKSLTTKANFVDALTDTISAVIIILGVTIIYILQIKKCIYEISLPKLNELQAKNRKRKFLAFVNPIGGKGNALTLWAKLPVIKAFSDTQNIDKQTGRNRMRKNLPIIVTSVCSGNNRITVW